jgi:hypothetical protein
LNFEKASDKVLHDDLQNILNNIGLNKADIRIVRNLYLQQSAVVPLENGTNDTIEIKRGVRQGCILSPMLFNIYAEQAFRKALYKKKEGVKIGGENTNNI